MATAALVIFWDDDPTVSGLKTPCQNENPWRVLICLAQYKEQLLQSKLKSKIQAVSSSSPVLIASMPTWMCISSIINFIENLISQGIFCLSNSLTGFLSSMDITVFCPLVLSHGYGPWLIYRCFNWFKWAFYRFPTSGPSGKFMRWCQALWHRSKLRSKQSPDAGEILWVCSTRAMVFWLVLYLPFWKIWKSIGMMKFPTEWKNNPKFPNYQPVLFHACLMILRFCSGVYTFSGNQHSTSFWYWQCISPHGLEPSPDLFQQSFSKLILFCFLTERAFSEMMTRRSL